MKIQNKETPNTLKLNNAGISFADEAYIKLGALRNAQNCFRKLLGSNSCKPTTASLKRLLLLKTSRTRKSTVAERDGPDGQN